MTSVPADTHVGIDDYTLFGEGIIAGTRLSNVLEFFDPTGGLPVNPTTGDRYLSSATANGWTIDTFQYWNGIEWLETAPTAGELTYVEGGATFPATAILWNGAAWSAFGGGSGDVLGPGASTADAIVRWGDATGTLVANSTVLVTGTGDIQIPAGGCLEVNALVTACRDANNNLVFGDGNLGAVTTATGVTAIGDGTATAVTSGNNGIFIGPAAGVTSSTGNNNVIIGSGADTDAGSYSAIAIGVNASSTTGGAFIGGVAIGASASTTDIQTVAIGDSTTASTTGAVVVGTQSTASATNAVAIGAVVNATATDAIGIGQGAGASGAGSIAVGGAASATVTDAIGIGSGSSATGISSIVIGDGAGADSDNAIAIGTNSVGNILYAVSIGYTATTTGTYGIAIGYGSSSTAGSTVSIGYNASATAADTVAIGSGASATVANTIVLGTATETVSIPGALQMPVAAAVGTTSILSVTSMPGAPTDLTGDPGGLAFDTTTNSLYVFDGVAWNAFTASNVPSSESISIAGAGNDPDIGVVTTFVSTTAAASGTLADGTAVGQIKYIVMSAYVGDYVMTVTNGIDATGAAITTITYTSAGLGSTLTWDGTNWIILNTGGVIA